MAKLPLTPKRWLLFLHLGFAGILLGTTTVFLILSLNAFLTKDESIVKGCFVAMQILSRTSLRASTIGVAVTGILLSVWTKWGLFRFYWIIVKEALMLAAIGIGLFGLSYLTADISSIVSSDGLAAVNHATYTWLFLAIILQIIMLALMFIVSVFKPWGQIRKNHGRRRETLG